jgi:hypothetical protein
MGLGEMRRGRVDTLYSEQESIRFVVKKSCFVPFLQRVAVSLTGSSGSPGRTGELRLSPNCAACQFNPRSTRWPWDPGLRVVHRFPDRWAAGPVFPDHTSPRIPSRHHELRAEIPSSRILPVMPLPESTWQCPTTGICLPDLPSGADPITPTGLTPWSRQQTSRHTSRCPRRCGRQFGREPNPSWLWSPLAKFPCRL